MVFNLVTKMPSLVLGSGFRGERNHLKLDAAHVRPPGELLLDRVTRAERHGDELPDEPFADGESIEPRLGRDDGVILRLAVQLRGPRCTGDGVDLSAAIFTATWRATPT